MKFKKVAKKAEEKNKLDKDSLTVRKKFNSKELDSIALQIKEKENQLTAITNDLDALYYDYAAERMKNFKIGSVYEYTEGDTTFKGVLLLKANRKSHDNPLKLQVIKKDGKLGTEKKVIYDENKLKYIGEREK